MSQPPFTPTPVLREANLKTLADYLPGASILIFRTGGELAPLRMEIHIDQWQENYPSLPDDLHWGRRADFYTDGSAYSQFPVWGPRHNSYRAAVRYHASAQARADAAQEFAARLEDLARARTANLNPGELSAAMAILVDELIDNHVYGDSAKAARS